MSISRSFAAVVFLLTVPILCVAFALPELGAALRHDAHAGDADAQYELARMYFEGDGVEQSTDQGIHWMMESADSGNPYAQLTYGLMLMGGQDVPQDMDKGLAMVRSAAEQELAEAQGVMSMAYGKGIGVQPDTQLFLYWMQALADRSQPFNGCD